jgi:site-specific DNA-methyltransferase (adenine-specific)/modification methylase
MSDGEIAWTNTTKSTRIFRHLWFGLARESEVGSHLHPTQKPIALMTWCIRQSRVLPGSLILDPYMGSGPTIRAAKDANCRAIGIEIEERYCEVAARRLEQGVFSWEN